MAAIVKSGTLNDLSSMCSSNPPQNKQNAGVAGEAFGPCDQAFLHTDGLYYKADASAADAASRVRGQVRFAASLGEPITITKGLRYHYTDTAGTPGDEVYLSATVPGGLDTVQSNAVPAVGYFLEDGKRIEFYEPR